MTGCTSASKSSLQPVENHLFATATELSKTIFFPTQEKTGGERAVMDGEEYGTLVLANNCIRLNRDDTDNSYLLIWPPDFNMIIENGTIGIQNGNGQIVAHIGDRVHIGGGGINLLLMLDKYIQAQVPPQCTGPYWIIDDWLILK